MDVVHVAEHWIQRIEEPGPSGVSRRWAVGEKLAVQEHIGAIR